MIVSDNSECLTDKFVSDCYNGKFARFTSRTQTFVSFFASSITPNRRESSDIHLTAQMCISIAINVTFEID